MQPLKTYTYLTLARQKLFSWVRLLSPEQYAAEFPIGPGSLARTLNHMLLSEWYYIERITDREVPPYAQWKLQDEKPLEFAALEQEWSAQSERTRATLVAVADWNAELEYTVTNDDGTRSLIIVSPLDIFTQLAFHEVHHRAQAMNMLRQLGVANASDLDYNTLMYTRVAVP